MEKAKSILIVGVGGQGIILASKMLTWGLMNKGFDVKMSEIHGMSQRGGSVSAQVRYGKQVHSPVIGLGEANILVSFEEMETYRWLKYLKPDGKVVMNKYQLPSAPILSGTVQYPQGFADEVVSKADTTVIDAMDIAMQLKAPRSMNMVLLGALVRLMGLEDINWESALEEMVKKQFVEPNLKALQIGIQQIKI
jgi:indolepyruvate ferredoxin oxidoreductase beta subunit